MGELIYVGVCMCVTVCMCVCVSVNVTMCCVLGVYIYMYVMCMCVCVCVQQQSKVARMYQMTDEIASKRGCVRALQCKNQYSSAPITALF